MISKTAFQPNARLTAGTKKLDSNKPIDGAAIRTPHAITRCLVGNHSVKAREAAAMSAPANKPITKRIQNPLE